MKIAVVGAGISGLAAAHVLARGHDVHVFEAGEKPGGHTNTIRVDTEHETHWVDTGFIVFNDRNYPNFEKLLVDHKHDVFTVLDVVSDHRRAAPGGDRRPL